jgi:uncharacterized protein affecting Mg2+/Co2+ transport
MNENIEVTVRCRPRRTASDARGLSAAPLPTTSRSANRSAELAQLISRHWIITDGNERRQEGARPGRGGCAAAHPAGRVLPVHQRRDAETAVGTMEGSYRMVRDDGREFSVPIPAFPPRGTACGQLTGTGAEFLRCPRRTPGSRPRSRQELLLIDHANCEKKAAGTAVNLMFRHGSDAALLHMLSRLAREELRHFEQVVELMNTRGIDYRPLGAARYAAGLRNWCAPTSRRGSWTR